MTDLGAEVVKYVSHAAQQRLQNLLEKVSLVAQQRHISFKVCLQHQGSALTSGVISILFSLHVQTFGSFLFS